MSDNALERRNKLVEEYRDYVEGLVVRLMQRMGLPRNLKDEFISAAYLGLVEAADRYNSKKGADFKAYAFLRIRGAVVDAVRRSCDVTERAYRILKSIEAAQNLREDTLELEQ